MIVTVCFVYMCLTLAKKTDSVEANDMLLTKNSDKTDDYQQYKEAIFMEGLQVEEEGLTDFFRNKIKQPSSFYDDDFNVLNKSNDVFDDMPVTMETKAYRKRKHRKKRAATAMKNRIWDYGVIPYIIDGNFSAYHKALFKRAMRHFENHTCLKFVERENDVHSNYIVFTEKPCGCCSFVGKRGSGPQAISIGRNCDKFGIIVHELGHVIGFWHEHTRPDRDKHVTIIRENVLNGQEYNFNKLTEDEVNSLGQPYDYDSIMHYADNTFSKGIYLDTIQPNADSHGHRPEIGQRIRLSKGDIAQTNILYNCFKCGKTYQTRTGIIESPLALIPNETIKCEYRITATHGETIVLTITELDIENSQNCSGDYLEIRDGYWLKSKLLKRLCGNYTVRDVIIGVSSRMLLTFISHNPQGHSGFKAKYDVICGGLINVTFEWTSLESPNYPDEYPPLKNCVWKLQTDAQYRIALKFQAFELENQDNCMYDYLQIIDGNHPINATTAQVYCGPRLPSDYLSSTNHIQIKFVSDETVQKLGFSVLFTAELDECLDGTHQCAHTCINTIGSYKCICPIGYELHSNGKSCEIACGGILNTTYGTITSPSFPEPYPSNKKCEYEIETRARHTITLNFTHFDLEGNNIHPDPCEYDRLEIYSRLSNNNLIRHGVFCGSITPNMIMSRSNVLKLIFKSDNSNQKSGFSAYFFTDLDECADNNGGCQHDCHNTLNSYYCTCHNGFILDANKRDCTEGNCKYEIGTATGKITSPNYPDLYQIRKECFYHFSTTPGHRVKLTFHEFEMESHPECYYDHIVIYDGNTPEARNLGRFCGSKTPPAIFSTSNQMLMVFKSDSSVQLKGFVARHETVCGGRLIATKDVKHLYSHVRFGSHNYDNKTHCEWILQAYANLSIRLSFIMFDLEGDSKTGCKFDFVEVFNDFDSMDKLYGRYCGKIKPKEIISSTDVLRIRFKTDNSNTFKGFSIAYQATESYDNYEIE